MAYIKVEIPNGEYCSGCRFLQGGTVLCTLFDAIELRVVRTIIES